MLLQALLLILSLAVLYYGAEFALDAAEKVGFFLGFSPLVVGLFIVGFGTSLPEFFVSHLACFHGEQQLAVGNIVGSNVANLFLILGVGGLLGRMYINRGEMRIQLFFHLALTALFSIILLSGELMWWGSLGLLCFFGGYLYFTFRKMLEGRHLEDVLSEDQEKQVLSPWTFVKLIAGFVFLYGGGELLVSSGTKLGADIGVSPFVISAIFVAFGTSFPEMMTALVIIRKGKNTDIIVGNIIGSNVFNVAFVMMSLYPYALKLKGPFTLEILALFFASFFLIALAVAKRNFYRYSATLFLIIYASMIIYWSKTGQEAQEVPRSFPRGATLFSVAISR